MKTVLSAVGITLAFHEPALGYLDPGTGSMLLQVILGGIAGLLVAGKLFWNRILAFLHIRKPEDLVDPTGDEERKAASE